jgi:hypothetical protein
MFEKMASLSFIFRYILDHNFNNIEFEKYFFTYLKTII